MKSARATGVLGVIAVVLALVGVFGISALNSKPDRETADSSVVPIAGEVIQPRECVGSVAVVCGNMGSAAFSLIAGQFPGRKFIGPSVITVLPDGRLRYDVRISDDLRNPDLDLEDFGDWMRIANWTELPDSQPFHQRWEQRVGVASALVLTARFSYEPPVGPQQYQKMTIVGTIETIEPVVPRGSQTPSRP